MEATEACRPLGLGSTEWLGSVKIPMRVAFERWQQASPAELWMNGRASLGGTAWEAYRQGVLDTQNAMEIAGWQYRWLDPEEGPSLWANCDADSANRLRQNTRYEVRAVYAKRPNHEITGAEGVRLIDR